MPVGAKAKTQERIPADEVELATIAQIKTVLSSPEAIAAVCYAIHDRGATLDEGVTVLVMTRPGDAWDNRSPSSNIASST